MSTSATAKMVDRTFIHALCGLHSELALNDQMVHNYIFQKQWQCSKPLPSKPYQRNLQKEEV